MSSAMHSAIQLLALVFCVPMIWGWQFVHWESRADQQTATYTYTLYSTLPPPPEGPAFCRRMQEGRYAVNIPCDWKPVFVWWLQRRMR